MGTGAKADAPFPRRSPGRSSCGALRSAELHERLIDACADGDADAAARVTARIWSALEELADEADEAD